MSTITRELAKLFRKITNSEIDAEGNAHVVLSPADSLLINNARIALASLEAEPVAWLLSGGGAKNNVSFDSGNAYADPLREVTPLYTAPPAPANAEPVAWLWSHRKHPSEVSLIRPEDDERAEGAHWSGWSCQALYAAPPAPVSVLDGYRLQPISEYDAMCAAMLQGANGTLTNEGTIPVTQFKPVADLYGLTSPTGGETSFTFDAVEARDFVDGGWSCQEYVEPERFQEAVSGNSAVIPDGWVDCSERMPEQSGRYWCYVEEQNDLGKSHYEWNCSWNGDRWWVESENGGRVTHWMPLPAAPQQEA
ncbi:DUF551 domain-containing protein [Enterobacter kobei]|uniref:DUF551 domain-containing protein n=1 Tax=Enterobacter kobei TaxID=208224 RepID=UPI002350723B|nr:DUF551 domain-containing protein [Enterobacter kobei]MDC7948800.1 DUF551 domain-containing protein [Enterobacter kobei]